MPTSLKARALGTALAMGMLAASGAAVAQTKINLINTGGVGPGTQAERGFRAAAAYWESVLTNKATLNINVSFRPLGPNILGGARSTLFAPLAISDYQALLFGAGRTQLDAIALANLSPLSDTGSISVIVPDYLDPAAMSGVATSGSRIAPDGTGISSTMAVSSSNLKAIFSDFDDVFGGDVVDADIAFSNEFDFDFDPRNGIDRNSFDFIGVAIHEIGHALGFLSAAEDFDFFAANPDELTFDVDDEWWGYAADMFRYSGEGDLDWTFGTDSYFSIDGGATALFGAEFSTGSEFGNGWQASHWRPPVGEGCDGFIGIMNPYICNGQADDVTASDLALLDAIGWNPNVNVLANPGYRFTTAAAFGLVPEPASWAMMIAGVGMVGGALRSTRRRKVTFATA